MGAGKVSVPLNKTSTRGLGGVRSDAASSPDVAGSPANSSLSQMGSAAIWPKAAVLLPLPGRLHDGDVQGEALGILARQLAHGVGREIDGVSHGRPPS
jgi:hypothetical protein